MALPKTAATSRPANVNANRPGVSCNGTPAGSAADAARASSEPVTNGWWPR
jgi:hypothetical protein